MTEPDDICAKCHLDKEGELCAVCRECLTCAGEDGREHESRYLCPRCWEEEIATIVYNMET